MKSVFTAYIVDENSNHYRNNSQHARVFKSPNSNDIGWEEEGSDMVKKLDQSVLDLASEHQSFMDGAYTAICQSFIRWKGLNPEEVCITDISLTDKEEDILLICKTLVAAHYLDRYKINTYGVTLRYSIRGELSDEDDALINDFWQFYRAEKEKEEEKDKRQTTHIITKYGVRCCQLSQKPANTTLAHDPELVALCKRLQKRIKLGVGTLLNDYNRAEIEALVIDLKC